MRLLPHVARVEVGPTLSLALRLLGVHRHDLQAMPGERRGELEERVKNFHCPYTRVEIHVASQSRIQGLKKTLDIPLRAE